MYDQVKQYLQDKKVNGVHILIGCFLETWFGYMQIWDPETRSFTFWGDGNEPWEITTFEDTARYTVEVVLDPTAVGTFFCESGLYQNLSMRQVLRKLLLKNDLPNSLR